MMNNYKQTAKKPRKMTALYERLSRDDDMDGLSNSILTQMQILEDFAKKNKFTNIRHFQDDGISGTTFDRKGWNELVEEVKVGNVAIVAVKDMSRLGRDHIQVGIHLELFRKHGVRFIAVGNNIDSNHPETLEFAPFINLISEYYARDISRKIKSAIHSNGNNGKRTSNYPIYGYKQCPETKQWLIDEPAAEIVRRIYQMNRDGMGYYQIARVLTEEEVLKPSHYAVKNGIPGAAPSKINPTEPYIWCGATVTTILSKPEYAGHTVNFRTTKESYKDKNYKRNPPEMWKIFHNTHEPIISQELFDTVQRLRGTPRRIDTSGEANPLTGIMFCADCGHKMYSGRKSRKPKSQRNINGKTYTCCESDIYTCGGYNMARKRFKELCTMHYIRTKVVRELALDAIRRICEYVNGNEAEFVEKVRELSVVQQEEAAKSHKNQIAKNERRIAELDMLFIKAYEDNSTGKLNDERYALVSGIYEKEQSDLRAQTATLQTELDDYIEDTQKAARFLEVAQRYTDFDELTNAMLVEFISKIFVHEADKSTGERTQRVDIHFNFIGNFEVPYEIIEPTAEEVEAEKQRLAKLERQRENNKRWYERRKAENEMKRALEAGEITQAEVDTLERERLAEKAAQDAERTSRTKENQRKYRREWAKRDRAKKRAEAEAQLLENAINTDDMPIKESA